MALTGPGRGPLRVVLASASPRRLQLLRAAGVEVEVRPADVDEAQQAGESARDMVIRLARAKAATVSAMPHGATETVVAADTTVVVDGRVLAKPASADEARAMLAELAGRAHDVLTGWCVRHGAQERSAVVATEVRFRPLTPDEIEAYIATGEPFDKAGGYGIQGAGGALVDTVSGSYPNVVGLPVREVLAAIRELQE